MATENIKIAKWGEKHGTLHITHQVSTENSHDSQPATHNTVWSHFSTHEVLFLAPHEQSTLTK